MLNPFWGIGRRKAINAFLPPTETYDRLTKMFDVYGNPLDPSHALKVNGVPEDRAKELARELVIAELRQGDALRKWRHVLRPLTDKQELPNPKESGPLEVYQLSCVDWLRRRWFTNPPPQDFNGDIRIPLTDGRVVALPSAWVKLFSAGALSGVRWPLPISSATGQVRHGVYLVVREWVEFPQKDTEKKMQGELKSIPAWTEATAQLTNLRRFQALKRYISYVRFKIDNDFIDSLSWGRISPQDILRDFNLPFTPSTVRFFIAEALRGSGHTVVWGWFPSIGALVESIMIAPDAYYDSERPLFPHETSRAVLYDRHERQVNSRGVCLSTFVIDSLSERDALRNGVWAAATKIAKKHSDWWSRIDLSKLPSPERGRPDGSRVTDDLNRWIDEYLNKEIDEAELLCRQVEHSLRGLNVFQPTKYAQAEARRVSWGKIRKRLEDRGVRPPKIPPKKNN